MDENFEKFRLNFVYQQHENHRIYRSTRSKPQKCATAGAGTQTRPNPKTSKSLPWMRMPFGQSSSILTSEYEAAAADEK